jgi:uncharacterized protein (TIGR01777 family)
MKIFLTGATGFIGRHLVRALLERGDRCTVVSRSGRDPWREARVRVVVGDPARPGDWQRETSGADAVINLAGERIIEPLKFWTPQRKRVLLASRVETTRQLAQAIRAASPRPAVLVSGSAVGYYGPRGDELLEESAPPGDDFLARLAVEWERAADEAKDVTRVCVIRTGFVLGRDAPAVAPLLPLFRLGLGGSWGSGRDWLSWVHIADLVGLWLFALEHPLAGAVNGTAPNPVRVDGFADALGRRLRRPVLFRMPPVGLRLALGEAADALLHLQRVVPARALAEGFQFRFPTLETALADLF